MTRKTLLELLSGGQWWAQLAVLHMSGIYYRACFLATAASEGILKRFANGPVPFDELSRDWVAKPELHDGLRAWLQVGVELGILRCDERGYSLKGRLAQKLADPASDALSAMLEEIVGLHYRLVVETPRRLREGMPFRLSDQNGELIARSSRIVEPFVKEAVDRVVPQRGAMRLLEIGCGSGVYIRHAANRNTSLSAIGLELQEAVATFARSNLSRWGLTDRAEVRAGDVRNWTGPAEFDLVTLHNNIYYFPVSERVDLLRHLRGLLKPGGKLLLTTGCQNGNAAMEVLSLWAAMTEGCGRLPARDEMVAQMEAAGFASVEALTLIPGPSFCAFVGQNPS